MTGQSKASSATSASAARAGKRMRVKTKPPKQAPVVGVDTTKEEDETSRKQNYLVTFPHPRATVSATSVPLKAPGDFTHQELLDAYLDSYAHPIHLDSFAHARAPSTVEPDRVGVFFEMHQADELGHAFSHGHLSISATAPFRFLPVKRALLARHGLASHWSCTHIGYWSVISYLCWPSPKKPKLSLDPSPLLWALGRPHPPLEECRHEPNTSKALMKRRLLREQHAAEEGKTIPRVCETDVYALVVEKGFRNTEDDRTAHKQLTLYAREHCHKGMWEYLWKNRGRLASFIDDVWQSEGLGQTLPRERMSRMEALHAAAAGQCVCGGEWLAAVVRSFVANRIDVQALCKDIFHLLEAGRSPGCPVLVLAGLSGGEGKSILLKAFFSLFMEGQVFGSPVAGNFPLLDLLNSKVCFWDEWRFDTAVLPWAVQCLLYDGSNVPVNRPQNVQGQSGHSTYTGSSPVFVTTKLADIRRLQEHAAINPKTGNPFDADASMLFRRLKIYSYTERISKPACNLPYCACCFARLVLEQAGSSN